MEWTSSLAYLSDDQLQHGMRRLVDGGSEHLPSLPQFLAFCRSAREYEPDHTRKLPAPDMGAWAITANHHFMAYLWAHPKGWTETDTRIFVAYKNAWAEDCEAMGNEIPIAKQQEMWRDCMARAEQDTGRACQTG